MFPRSSDAPAPLIQRISIPSSLAGSFKYFLPRVESVATEVFLRSGRVRRGENVGFNDGVGETIDHGVDSEGED